MFCNKCGNKLTAEAAFCNKCGAKMAAGGEQSYQPPVSETASKKSIWPKNKLISGIAAAAVVIVLALVINAIFSGGRTDYVETVRQHTPFEDFGLDLSYGAAVSRFMTSVRWTDRRHSDDTVFVDATGNLAEVGGESLDVTVTFRLTPFVGRDGFYNIYPHSLEINGRLFREAAADYFLTDFFNAYEDGFDSIAAYYASYGLTSIFDYIRTNFN